MRASNIRMRGWITAGLWFVFVRMDLGEVVVAGRFAQASSGGPRGKRAGVIIVKSLLSGPVAQLGARFHGMEEVESSNLSRSTRIYFASIVYIFGSSRSGL
jgi:hypothetical protein